MRTNRTLLVFATLGMMATSSQADVLVNDNFFSFNSGDLVGQGNWLQQGASATNPIQVGNGKVILPNLPVGSGDNQDARRNFNSVTGGTVYLAVSMKITGTTSSGDSSYFLALRDSADGFDNFRFATRPGSQPGTFVLRTRGTGQGGNPFVGSGDLPLNTTFTFIGEFNLVANPGFSDWKLYVDPTSPTPGDNPIYSSQTLTTGNPPGFGSVILSQFTSSTVEQSGVEIGQIVVATSFAEAFAAIPEPSSAALLVGAALLATRRRRAR